MLLHLSLHLLADEDLRHSAVYIILMSVSCKPELTIIITCSYKKMTNQVLQSFALFLIWVDWGFFWGFFCSRTHSLLFSARFVFLRWTDVQCPVWSRVSVLGRCLNLPCVEAHPTVVLKGGYRGEVECESVTPTALTVTEGCRSLGRGEHRTSVCWLSCVAFHHRPSAEALQEFWRFWLSLKSGFFGNSLRLHLGFCSHFLHSVVNSSVRCSCT